MQADFLVHEEGNKDLSLSLSLSLSTSIETNYLCDPDQKSELLLAARRTQFEMYQFDHPCWYSGVQMIFSHLQIQPSETKNTRDIKDFIYSKYTKVWRSALHAEFTKPGSRNKLRTFRKFKSNLLPEQYLKSHDIKFWLPSLKFRVSAHRLSYEVMRYNTPYIPPDQRFCQICGPPHIGDEYHLFTCGALKQLREKYKIKVDGYPQFIVGMRLMTTAWQHYIKYALLKLEHPRAKPKNTKNKKGKKTQAVTLPPDINMGVSSEHRIHNYTQLQTSNSVSHPYSVTKNMKMLPVLRKSSSIP